MVHVIESMSAWCESVWSYLLLASSLPPCVCVCSPPPPPFSSPASQILLTFIFHCFPSSAAPTGCHPSPSSLLLFSPPPLLSPSLLSPLSSPFDLFTFSPPLPSHFTFQPIKLLMWELIHYELITCKLAHQLYFSSSVIPIICVAFTSSCCAVNTIF